MIGILFLALMVSSPLLYLIPSFFSPPLPEGSVVKYELSREQEIEMLKRGRVVIKFFYSEKCEFCEKNRDVLESFAFSYPSQIILEEIKSNNVTTIFIGFNITSSGIGLDRREIEGELNESVVRDILCEIMLEPPVECVGI